MKIKLKNKRNIIFIILFIFLLVILSIVINSENISSIYNTYIKKLSSDNEDNLISIDVSIKATQDDITKCLLTFTANDENEKIKSIEYPGEDHNIITVNNEEGKEKIAIDYDIEKGKEDSTFKVTTTGGQEISKRTGYVIEYKNGNGDTFKTLKELKDIKHKIISTSPTKEGKHFVGWSTHEDAEMADYFENGEYGECNKDVILYPIWIGKQSGKTETIEN